MKLRIFGSDYSFTAIYLVTDFYEVLRRNVDFVSKELRSFSMLSVISDFQG